MTDLSAIEAAHDALWQTLNHPPRHLSGAELSAQRTANDDALSALMRPVLDADPTHCELIRLGYARIDGRTHPYRDAGGQWKQTGRHLYRRGNVQLSLFPPRDWMPTLAATLAQPYELSPLATGPTVQGGAGLHTRLRDMARQVAQQLHDDGLHERVQAIQLTHVRRQHPNTNAEGVNYNSNGLSGVHRYYDTAAFV